MIRRGKKHLERKKKRKKKKMTEVTAVASPFPVRKAELPRGKAGKAWTALRDWELSSVVWCELWVTSTIRGIQFKVCGSQEGTPGGCKWW